MRGASGPPPAVTRAAVLTSEGRGAIAVIRVWGSGALAVTDAVFRPAAGGPLSASPPGTPRFGRAGLGLGDEVVALVLPGDPPECEIQGHAGRAAVDAIIQALERAGAEIRNGSAWIRSTAGSVVEAEARVDLARAPTARAAEILLEQVQGALVRAFEALAAELIDQPGAAAARVDRLLDRAEIGLHLADGWRVAIVGRPNVGKSRLLNALGGFDRAIVDPTPGTTRDVVSLTTAFDGWPVDLRDTAGQRTTGDAVERAGIGAGREAGREADLVLLVLDRSEPLGDVDRGLLAEFPAALVVANKADLTPAWAADEIGAFAVSAERGDGVEALGHTIAGRLVAEAPGPGEAVPFRRRHRRLLESIRRALSAGDLDAARGAFDALRGATG